MDRHLLAHYRIELWGLRQKRAVRFYLWEGLLSRRRRGTDNSVAPQTLGLVEGLVCML